MRDIAASERYPGCQYLAEEQFQQFLPVPLAVCKYIIPDQVILQIFRGDTVKSLYKPLQSAVIGIDPLDTVRSALAFCNAAVRFHLYQPDALVPAKPI